jgi:Fe2+ transport system protein FeoA
MRPLALCQQGERVMVRVIAGGMGVRRRLESMGLYPGEEVEVVSAQGGPIILNVKGCRLGIGCGMAHKIMVSNNGEKWRK